ncbi:MAG: InlB B-repeat-containing protein [Erysipelotrichaceae bacterium]|nr:InlB B-repeat-containing protein [Erysipelotrichaceae bacterium]
MKKDLLKKISKVLVVMLVLGMFMSNARISSAEDDEVKIIAVGETYNIGDTVNFNGGYYDNGKGNVLQTWTNKIDHSMFDTTDNEWIVNMKWNDGTLSLWFSGSFTGNEIVKGIKCVSGDGTQSSPYRFELVYVDPLVATIKVINGTRSSDEGSSGDHTVIESEATVYCEPEKYVTLGFLQPNDGYTKTPVVKKDGQAVTLSTNASKPIGYGWEVSYYEAGHFPDTYPNGWIRISGSPTAGANFVVEYQPISYTIIFDGNGGEGEMDDFVLKYGEEKALPDCTFEYEGYTFVGWGVEQDGPADYEDGESVKNLTTTDGDTITLFAQWEEGADVYEEIDEVNIKITPPKAGDKITIDVETYSQDPQPTVTLPSGAPYRNNFGEFRMAYWIKSESYEGGFEDVVFEGTYKEGDTFYALITLTTEEEIEEGAPVGAVADDVYYCFAEDLKVNVEGAELVSAEVYDYGTDYVDIVVKGKIEKEEEKETKPIVPINVPKTGIEGPAFPSLMSCISMLGLCLTAVVLNKKR